MKNPIVPIATIAIYETGFPIGSCAGGTKDKTRANKAAKIPIPASNVKAGAL